MRALILKEFRELSRDRRTLAMLIVLPVVLLVIFGYAANFSVDKISVAVTGTGADSLATSLRANAVAADELHIATVSPGASQAEQDALLRDQQVDAVITQRKGADADAPLADRLAITLDGSALFTAQAAQGVFMRIAASDAQDVAEAQREDAAAQIAEAESALEAAVQAAIGAAATGGGPPNIALPEFPRLPEFTPPDVDAAEYITVAFNPDLKTSWVMVPGLIGLILLFIGALITSIGLVREREAGTFEQLAVMPLRPSAIILGKIVPYFVLALVDMVAVTALGVWLFGVPFTGSIWLFALASLVFLFVVLGAGVLISSSSENTGQAIQMAILFVVPQVLLSGLIFPLEAMPGGVRWIGYVLPLTWFREISQGVMLRAADLGSLWLPLVVLAAMAVVVFGAATRRMAGALGRGGRA